MGICIGFMKEVETERGTFSVVRKEGRRSGISKEKKIVSSQRIVGKKK